MKIVVLSANNALTSAIKELLVSSNEVQEVTASQFIDYNQGTVNIRGAFNNNVSVDDLFELSYELLCSMNLMHDPNRAVETMLKHMRSANEYLNKWNENPSADVSATYWRYARQYHKMIATKLKHQMTIHKIDFFAIIEELDFRDYIREIL